jgi:hypothetical protein
MAMKKVLDLFKKMITKIPLSNKNISYLLIAQLGLAVTALIFVLFSHSALTLDVDTDTGESVYVCGYEEHTHGDGCYGREFICVLEGKPDGADTPVTEGETTDLTESVTEEAEITTEQESTTEAETAPEDEQSIVTVATPTDLTESTTEPETTAGESVHIHTGDCYAHTLMCGLEEHTHEEDCRAQGIASAMMMGIDALNAETTTENSTFGMVSAPVQDGNTNCFTFATVQFELKSTDHKIKISSNAQYAEYLEIHPDTVAVLIARGIAVSGNNLKDGIILGQTTTTGLLTTINNFNLRFIPKTTP